MSCEKADDQMKSGSYSPVTGKVKDVFQFLLWKSSIIPEHFTNEDLKIINNHDLGKLTSLSIKGYSYSKSVMKHYSEQLWQSSINSQYQLEGYTEAPTVSATKLKFPPKSSRQLETLFLSLFYPNNIMNVGEGRKIHLPAYYTDCPDVQADKRKKMSELLERHFSTTS